MKLYWEESNPKNPLQLSAYGEPLDPNKYVEFITEDDMVEVANWCSANNCGKRTSFDTFRFKNAKQKTMFLLRWSS